MGVSSLVCNINSNMITFNNTYLFYYLVNRLALDNEYNDSFEAIESEQKELQSQLLSVNEAKDENEVTRQVYLENSMYLLDLMRSVTLFY
jgi:hypothetical protein